MSKYPMIIGRRMGSSLFIQSAPRHTQNTCADFEIQARNMWKSHCKTIMFFHCCSSEIDLINL